MVDKANGKKVIPPRTLRSITDLVISEGRLDAVVLDDGTQINGVLKGGLKVAPTGEAVLFLQVAGVFKIHVVKEAPRIQLVSADGVPIQRPTEG
jgi:hypothetical protein